MSYTRLICRRSRLDWRICVLCGIIVVLLASLLLTRPPRRRVAVVHGNGLINNYLNHVIRVLTLVGYDVQSGYKTSSSSHQTDENWDLLWTHSYPFGSMPELKHLRRHQKVNKIPGMGFITNKVSFFEYLKCKVRAVEITCTL